MLKIRRFPLFSLVLFFGISCSSPEEDLSPSQVIVDPTNSNALSKALKKVNSDWIMEAGEIPFHKNDKALFSTLDKQTVDMPLGSKASLDLNTEMEEVDKVLLKVEGSEFYFEVPLSSSGGRSKDPLNTFEFSFKVPENISDGKFCLNIWVKGTSNTVSNSIQTCFRINSGTQTSNQPSISVELPVNPFFEGDTVPISVNINSTNPLAAILGIPSSGVLQNVALDLIGKTAEYRFIIPNDGSHSITFTALDSLGGFGTNQVIISTGGQTIDVDSNIVTDETWYTGNTYILRSRIVVENGAKLTIEPGVLIKGDVGMGQNATMLVVSRGAKIDAQGTASLPIVFTAISDQITSEMIREGFLISPNLSSSNRGLWGGVLVLGNAPVSLPLDSIEGNIIGGQGSDPNLNYGGNDPNENSGILKFVSIRHSGSFETSDHNGHLNGLTLAGVGNGTIVSNIEIIGSGDDGIESLGGFVNSKNILVWDCNDDAFDCDQGFGGTIDNFIGIAGSETDHLMELDGPEGSYKATMTLTNGSLKHFGRITIPFFHSYADLRDGCRAILNDIYMFNGIAISDFQLDDDETSGYFSNGISRFSKHQINASNFIGSGVTVDSIYQDRSNIGNAFQNISPTTFASLVTSRTTVADKSVFQGWTWADQAGELNDF